MRRQLAWRQARSDLQADRATPPEIREERLRGWNLDRPGSVSLSAWRGRSGRRYVVQVHELDIHWPVRAGAGLAFAVARAADGFASIIDVAPDSAGPAWRGRAWDAGARELHVYILVDDEAGRAEVALDLMPDAIANRPVRA
ncbi:hypothetical protein E4V01_07745 [Methylorubrum sp. Q1]|uniref:hypothetical protein n=1 Tax=Methylorubrum sp. Q1 TaxID=2562453 RepID=UPI001076B85B|nr:hypothetical protein [Methylorubrum sp. Q1]TFZ59332.1 hypothetical protein E4V01_07745 [Methylorubrum sp. Q1]